MPLLDQEHQKNTTCLFPLLWQGGVLQKAPVQTPGPSIRGTVQGCLRGLRGLQVSNLGVPSCVL